MSKERLRAISESRRKKLFLILDNIRSAYNVGSIFRTADAAGVSKIFLCGLTPIPGQPGRAGRDIAKTALGAENYVAWECKKDTWRTIEQLKKEKFQIVALERHRRSIPIYRFRPRWPMVLVVGNEVKGLSRRILNRADKIIEIPMLGKKKSLNVAVAFGIAAFAIRFCSMRSKPRN